MRVVAFFSGEAGISFDSALGSFSPGSSVIGCASVCASGSCGCARFGARSFSIAADLLCCREVSTFFFQQQELLPEPRKQPHLHSQFSLALVQHAIVDFFDSYNPDHI